jgi:hypothetical protein
VAGNKAGRGNPFTRRLAAMRQVILDTIDTTKLRALVEALYAQALAGDVAAARTLLAYVVGKPSSSVDPDALDRDEWKQCQEWPHGADVLAALGKVVFGDALRMLYSMQSSIVPVSSEGENATSVLFDGQPHDVPQRPTPGNR